MLNYFRALTPLLTEDCMVEKRHDIRADCKEKGVLYFGETSYLVKVNNFWIRGIFITYDLMPKKCLRIINIPVAPKLQKCSLSPEIGVALSVPVTLQGR